VWFDVDQDTVDEKCLLTISPDEPDVPLKLRTYDRPSGRCRSTRLSSS